MWTEFAWLGRNALIPAIAWALVIGIFKLQDNYPAIALLGIIIVYLTTIIEDLGRISGRVKDA